MTDIEALIDALLAAPVARQRPVIVVYADDGRCEVEVHADDFRIEPDNTLTLLDADGGAVASLPASAWSYAKGREHSTLPALRRAAWLRMYLRRRGPTVYRRLCGDARAGGLDGRQLSESARLLGVQFLQCPDGPAWYLPPHSRSDAERLVRELMHGGRSELGEANRRRVMRDAIEILLGEN